MRIRCTYCNWVGSERELLVRPIFSEALTGGSLLCAQIRDDDDRCPRCDSTSFAPKHHAGSRMTSLTLVQRAELVATELHAAARQKRKYTGEPYIVHPRAVAALVASVPHSQEMLAAAWLHDVLEDTQVSEEFLRSEFGPTVAYYVWELTNCETSVGNRATRFALNADRLRLATDAAQTIKIADLIDNTATIVANDPKFARLYLQEKQELLETSLRHGNRQLWQRAHDQCLAEQRRLSDAA